MNRTAHTAPRRYSPLITLGLIVAGAVVLLVLVLALRDALDPLRRAEAWYAYERQQRLDEQLSALDTAVAAGWRVLPLLLVAGAGVVGLLALYHRLAARRFVEADKLIALQRAQRQQFPDSLQTLAFHDSSRQERAALPEPEYGEEEGDEPDVRAVPTFAALLDAGKLGKGTPLILGYDLATGAAVEGTWLDAYSSALAGMPHSGKTTTQRSTACQLALWGARFVVADPHLEAGDDSLGATLDPLRSIYLAEPASAPSAILDAVRLVDDIGRRRVEGERDRTPVVLWVDELNGLLQDPQIGPALAALLKETARAYRKVGVFLSCVAHTWTASSTGGSTDLRANFASRIVHRMERQQARNLVPTELAPRAERLEVGQAILHSMRHSTIVQVPLTTAADVQRVARMLADTAPTIATMASVASNGQTTGNQPASKASASESPIALSPERARILALFAEGKDTAEIVKTIWPGVTNGRRYTEASRDVLATIRQALRGEA